MYFDNKGSKKIEKFNEFVEFFIKKPMIPLFQSFTLTFLYPIVAFVLYPTHLITLHAILPARA